MSRFLHWSCCALCSLLTLATASDGFAQGKQVTLRTTPQPHQPTYDYRPVDPTLVASRGIGYCGPLNCGAVDARGDAGNCRQTGCNCGGAPTAAADMAAADYGSSSDCGCNSCSSGCGSCGACNTSDCGGYYGDCNMGCSEGNCCYGECGVPCQPECDQPRATFFGEFLYLQVTGADVTHAQQQDGLGGAGTVPFGEIGTIGQDFNPGFRVGGSLACGACTAVYVSFTHFESDSFSSLDAPSNTNSGAVGSLVHVPGAALTASLGPVDATYNVDFQLGDVVWRRLLLDTERYDAAFSAGFEYGHLDQQFGQVGVFSGGLGGEVDTRSAISFDGAGIKVGVDGDHQFNHGLGIYGRFTASGLTGRFKSNYTMFNNTTDQMLAQANWTDDRVIGRLEYELGATITSADGHWRAGAGYLFSYWTNAVTTANFIDAVKSDNYSGVSDTIGFNGLVTHVECRW